MSTNKPEKSHHLFVKVDEDVWKLVQQIKSSEDRSLRSLVCRAIRMYAAADQTTA
jgi:hypothetical protein